MGANQFHCYRHYRSLQLISITFYALAQTLSNRFEQLIHLTGELNWWNCSKWISNFYSPFGIRVKFRILLAKNMFGLTSFKYAIIYYFSNITWAKWNESTGGKKERRQEKRTIYRFVEEQTNSYSFSVGGIMQIVNIKYSDNNAMRYIVVEWWRLCRGKEVYDEQIKKKKYHENSMFTQ